METPPNPHAGPEAERPVRCPFCGSAETEPYALFGSTLLMSQHYCRACRSVFERIRDDEPDEAQPAA
jgi:ring-1,2-phenylacetyl-CoA epoxidase subunit PaaD